MVLKWSITQIERRLYIRMYSAQSEVLKRHIKKKKKNSVRRDGIIPLTTKGNNVVVCMHPRGTPSCWGKETNIIHYRGELQKFCQTGLFNKNPYSDINTK